MRSYQRILWRWRSAEGCWFCHNYSPLLPWREEGNALPSESQALVFHLHGPVIKQVINEQSSNKGIHVTVKQPNYTAGISFPQQRALSVVTLKSRDNRLFPAKSPWAGKLHYLWRKSVTVQCPSQMLTNRWGLVSKFVAVVLRRLYNKSFNDWPLEKGTIKAKIAWWDLKKKKTWQRSLKKGYNHMPRCLIVYLLSVC